MTVSRKLSRYRLDLVGLQDNGMVLALHQQENTNVCTEREMRTMNWVQGFLYIKESYQQLRGLSLLVIGCHNTVRSLVSYRSGCSCPNRG
jgi:hypothetical protein